MSIDCWRFFAGMRGCDEFTDRGHRQIDEVTERGGCQRLTMQENHPPPLREQFHSYATILFYAVWVKTQQMNNSRNVWPLVILWNTTTNTFKYRSMLHNNCRCRKRITQRIWSYRVGIQKKNIELTALISISENNDLFRLSLLTFG